MALAFRQLYVVKCGIESTFNTKLTTITAEKREGSHCCKTVHGNKNPIQEKAADCFINYGMGGWAVWYGK